MPACVSCSLKVFVPDPSADPIPRNSTFTWRGVGEMPADQRATLRRIVNTAHADGQRVRFWETPDLPGAARDEVWSELLAADVDHINTDDLAGLRQFLLTHDSDVRAAA